MRRRTTSRSSSLQAAAAADEVDALVAARIGDAENRLDDVPGEQRDRQPRHRVGAARRLGRELGLAAPDDTSGRPRTMPTSSARAGRTG